MWYQTIFSTGVLALGKGFKQVMKDLFLAWEAMGCRGKRDQSGCFRSRETEQYKHTFILEIQNYYIP